MASWFGNASAATPVVEPPMLSQSASSASSATTASNNEVGNALVYTYKIQIFPHRENAQILGAIPGSTPAQRFHFEPIERDLKQGMVLKIGRKVDKKPPPAPLAQPDEPVHENELPIPSLPTDIPVLPSSYQSTSGFLDHPPPPLESHAISNSSAPTPVPATSPLTPDFIAFKSKVVSRAHAELWVSDEGQVLFKDVGSSSGTWVNRHRLSPSGKESREYVVKSGDVVQLGMDYQGRQEDMYKSVVMKIFVTMRSKDPPKPNPYRLRASLRALLSAMNPTSQSATSTSCTDCCICLSPLSPLQTLFLAPCSHCFHFRCVMPLLGSSVMFQCPLCRQVANLEKGVGEDEESLFEGEEGGDVAGEASLEEWLGVLRVEQAQGGAVVAGQVDSPAGVAGDQVMEEVGGEGDVVKDLEGVLGEVLPGLDEVQTGAVLERFRRVVEGRKLGGNV
ncbi:hypothetical protein HDU98_007775 [Podochytrium sp. JEL0797]|nr:hypothetical protein HDU98_007775 [Podochytrium sp. JEL0797]